MSFNRSLEKGPTELEQVAPANDRYHFEKSDLDRVQRRLKQRHVQMLVFYFILLTRM
jgi:amino acid transporter